MKITVKYLFLALISPLFLTACTPTPPITQEPTPQEVTTEVVDEEVAAIEAELDVLDDTTDFPDLAPEDFTE